MRPTDRSRRARKHVFTLLLLATASLWPAAAQGAVEPREASLESGSFAEFSQTNVDDGALAPASGQAYDGDLAALATYDGGGDNGYARGIWNVEWNDGEEVWFGAAYYLPSGFHSQVQGQVDLLRWDNWASHPSDTDWGGVSIYGSDRRARLLRFGAGRPNDTLVGPVSLPEGRWFTLEVHQRLSAGPGALSELYLDGALVGSSTAPNSYGRGIERIRYGIVAIASGSQQKPLALRFDRATAGPQAAGPVAVAGTSASRTAAPAATQGCTSRRRTRRQGPVWTRHIAVVCHSARRSCRTVWVRTRSRGGGNLRRTRTCNTGKRICLARNRIVLRHGKRPRKSRTQGCRSARR